MNFSYPVFMEFKSSQDLLKFKEKIMSSETLKDFLTLNTMYEMQFEFDNFEEAKHFGDTFTRVVDPSRVKIKYLKEPRL
jgi:hypothetical protein